MKVRRKAKVEASASGLAWSSIEKYAGNPLLERSDEGEPIYMHRANCVNFCDYACNGVKGWNIAKDVDTLESQRGHK